MLEIDHSNLKELSSCSIHKFLTTEQKPNWADEFGSNSTALSISLTSVVLGTVYQTLNQRKHFKNLWWKSIGANRNWWTGLVHVHFSFGSCTKPEIQPPIDEKKTINDRKIRNWSWSMGITVLRPCSGTVVKTNSLIIYS
jgi:hypothetical protein